MREIPNGQNQGGPERSTASGNAGNERLQKIDEDDDVESTQSISLEQQELFKGKKVDEDIESEDDLPMEQRDL